MAKNPLRIYGNRRILTLLPLGFASGLPYHLLGSTLSAWMTNLHFDLTTVGLFTWVSLPYTIKFAWAPLLDRYQPGFLGRRRGWIVLSQMAVAAALLCMTRIDPRRTPLFFAIAALMVAFSAASQDCSFDAYTTEVARPEERAGASSMSVLGYRMGMLVASALALGLADHYAWNLVYTLMACLMGIGLIAAISAPEPTSIKPPRTLRESVVEPFKEFRSRRGTGTALVFLSLYRLGDQMAAKMVTPFLIQYGYTKTEIGTASKVVGMAATLTGGILGGMVVARIGLWRSLLLFGILQAASNLGYYAVAVNGRNLPLMFGAMAADNLCTGMAVGASVALVMTLCNKRYTATQFSLLTSASGWAGHFLGGGSGYLAKHVGWPTFFLTTMSMAVPGIGLLFVLRRLGLFEERVEVQAEIVGN